MGMVSKILIGALCVLAIATFLLTKYSFSLKASLDVANNKYETLSEYSVKQATLLEEERKSNLNLTYAFNKLDKEYDATKKQINALPEVNGCLAESDVTHVLCTAGIYGGDACAQPTDTPESNSPIPSN